MAEFEIRVTTATRASSSSDGAGNDSTVFVRLTGSEGQSDFIRLDDKIFVDEFEPGSTDRYTLDVDRALGSIETIELKTDGSGHQPDWRLGSVLVVPPRGAQRNFPANGFVLNRANEFYVRLDERGVAPAPVDANSTSITIRTATGIFAGTDSNVFLTIIGTTGSTGELPLTDTTSPDPFEIGSEDTFVVAPPDYGAPVRVILRSDGSRWWAPWRVANVAVAGPHGTFSYRARNRRGIELRTENGLKVYLSEAGAEPRFTDVTADNTIALLDRPDAALFSWAAHNEKQQLLIDQRIHVGQNEPSFASEFFDSLHSGTLYRKLDQLFPDAATDPDAADLLARLKDWVEMRERTRALFDRLDEYLERLRIDMQEELEELEDAFTQPLKVEVDYHPAEQSDLSDGLGAAAMLFNVATVTPIAPIAMAAMAMTTGLTLAKQLSDSQLQGPSVTSTLTGGRAPLLDLIDDEFHRIGVESELFAGALRDVSHRSLAMLEQAAELEIRVATAVRRVERSRRAAVLSEYFPVMEGLRESVKPFWTQMLLSEAYLEGTDAGGSPSGLSGLLAGSSATHPGLITTDWQLVFRTKPVESSGPVKTGGLRFVFGGSNHAAPSDPGHQMDYTTRIPQKVLTRLFWIYSSRELIRLMVQNGRAYRHVEWNGTESDGLLGNLPSHETGWVRLDRTTGGGFDGDHLNVESQRYWNVYEQQVRKNALGSFDVGASTNIQEQWPSFRSW